MVTTPATTPNGALRPGPPESLDCRPARSCAASGSRPGTSIKHLIRAITRYGDRLGSQFAGAMTYFSFLSLVPILMVGFSIGGIVLANNQELLTELEKQVRQAAAGRASPNRSPA